MIKFLNEIRIFEFLISKYPEETLTPKGDIDGYVNLIFNDNLTVSQVITFSKKQQGKAILYGVFKNVVVVRELLREIEKTKKAEVSKARKEASTIMAAAEVDAKKKADEIIKKAHDKAKEEVASMTKAAEKEIENAKTKLQKEAATIAAAMAKKALEGALSAKEIETITAKMLKN